MRMSVRVVVHGGENREGEGDRLGQAVGLWQGPETQVHCRPCLEHLWGFSHIQHMNCCPKCDVERDREAHLCKIYFYATTQFLDYDLFLTKIHCLCLSVLLLLCLCLLGR